MAFGFCVFCVWSLDLGVGVWIWESRVLHLDVVGTSQKLRFGKFDEIWGDVGPGLFWYILSKLMNHHRLLSFARKSVGALGQSQSGMETFSFGAANARR